VIVKLASESDADFATVVGTANVPPVALFACARRTSGPEPANVVPFITIGVGRVTTLLRFTVPFALLGNSTDCAIPALNEVVPPACTNAPSPASMSPKVRFA
jgi:hypothetical protein